MLFMQDGKKVWIASSSLDDVIMRLSDLDFNLYKKITAMTIFLDHNKQVIKFLKYYEMFGDLKIKTDFENEMIYVYVKGKILDIFAFLSLMRNQIDVSVADSYVLRDRRLLKKVELDKRMDVKISPNSSLIIKFLSSYNLDDGFYIIDGLSSLKDWKRLYEFLSKVFQTIYKCDPNDVLVEDNLTLEALSLSVLDALRINSRG